jgi:hypothetical protein
VNLSVKPIATAGAFTLNARLTTGTSTFAVTAGDYRQVALNAPHPYNPLAAVDATNPLVQDWATLATGVSGTFRWSNSTGLTFGFAFAGTTTLGWEVRRSADGTLVQPAVTASVAVTISGLQLCASNNFVGISISVCV